MSCGRTPAPQDFRRQKTTVAIRKVLRSILVCFWALKINCIDYQFRRCMSSEFVVVTLEKRHHLGHAH